MDFYSLPPEEQQAILNGPAVPPPDNVVPNFTNPQSQNTAPRVILGFCLAVNTILVGLRVYSRLFIVKKTTYADCKCRASPPPHRETRKRTWKAYEDALVAHRFDCANLCIAPPSGV